MMIVNAPIRGQDAHGSGEFGAPRGDHTHEGVDIACYAGSVVYAVSAGKVTKIGKPYYDEGNKRGRNHLRYVQVTDADGVNCRYFYVAPGVQVGDQVRAGEPIGKTQGLAKIYPGITDHFHFEVKTSAGAVLNPHAYLDERA